MGEGQQPALHDLVTVLCAPSVAISAPDGQLEPGGAQGVYRNDRRMLSALRFGVVGADLIPTGSSTLGAGARTFHGVVRDHADLGPDPTVRYVRERTVDDAGVTESWSIRNDATVDIRITVTLVAASDLAGMDAIKAGLPTTAYPPTVASDRVRWEDERRVVELVPSEPSDLDADGVLRWDALVPARGRWDVRLRVDMRGETSTIGFLPQRPTIPVEIAAPTGDATVGGHATGGGHATADGEAQRLLQRSLSDLGALQLADPDRDGTTFLAAGSPWYFTLFGRDSLWAARLLLPANTVLAAGTLRVLASLQGNTYDPDTHEEPGKIPHELRPAAIEHGPGQQAQLPALYYGTVDATPLWVCLLHEAWRGGMPEDEVAELIPTLRRALSWIAGPGDADGDGFLEYVARPGVGLSNQGWKDSGDGIRWADGTQATGPIALSEAQAYAYAAAIDGAELLQALGDQCPDGSLGGSLEEVASEVAHWRTWAASLRRRFRDAFWISDEYGTYPAIALDGSKRPVTGPASNMGHLLGTGLLDADDVGLVAEQLAHPSMNSGYGLRTLSSDTAGYNPLSYHCGSVWPHDTAIAVMGLAVEGQHETAQALARGVVRAARRFDDHIPELYGGTDATANEPVVAYPAACAPQAWSAAGAAAIATYLAGDRSRTHTDEGH